MTLRDTLKVILFPAVLLTHVVLVTLLLFLATVSNAILKIHAGRSQDMLPGSGSAATAIQDVLYDCSSYPQEDDGDVEAYEPLPLGLRRP